MVIVIWHSNFSKLKKNRVGWKIMANAIFVQFLRWRRIQTFKLKKTKYFSSIYNFLNLWKMHVLWINSYAPFLEKVELCRIWNVFNLNQKNRFSFCFLKKSVFFFRNLGIFGLWTFFVILKRYKHNQKFVPS